MTRLQPIHDRLTVELVETSSMTASGFLVPEIVKSNKPWQIGTVLEVGTGRVNLEGKIAPMVVKKGDVVAFPKSAGVMFPLPDGNGVEHEVILLREADVLGIVHDMPKVTSIVGLDGQLVKMAPVSRGLPDVAYRNEDDLQRAERMGFVEPGEYPPDEFQPGDGPDNVVPNNDQGHS